jgi:hypothetical protein
MSAEEFTQWKLMFTAEQLHPYGEAERHAELLATLHNGEMRRRDKRPWTAAHFFNANPWAPPKVRTPKTNAQIDKSIERLNARLRRRRGKK